MGLLQVDVGLIIGYSAGLLAATSVCLTAIGIWLAPRLTMRAFAVLDRATRAILNRGDWYFLEKQFRQLWIPADVKISTPEDMRRYMISERAVTSSAFWIARMWALFCLALAGPAFVILAVLPSWRLLFG